jgi:hypothetical protein
VGQRSVIALNVLDRQFEASGPNQKTLRIIEALDVIEDIGSSFIAACGS